MNTPLHPARRLSRRTFVGTALMGAAVSGGVGLPTSMLAAQGTPAPAGALGQTPLGEQLAWLLATLNDGASALSAEDVSAKFAPGFLTAVPPDLVIAIIQQAASGLGPFSLDGFTRAPTETQANALTTSSSGLPVVVPIAVEPAPPHLITGFNVAPVPPPSGVELTPSVDSAGTPVPTVGRRDGLVDVGGREFYLSSLGTESPTVLLESGANDSAAPWFAVENAVASFTRVCSYDRANSVASASDPAPVPRTGEDVVADLHALLGAADVHAPYVLVGHSIGGIFVRLFAGTYPDEVAGLVLVDSSHEEQNERLQEVLSPEQWAAYQQMAIVIEGLDLEASFAQMREAREEAPLRPMPVAVVSAGLPPDAAMLPPDWPVAEEAALWAEHQQDLVALVPGTRHIVAEQSGHYVHQSEPDLVVEAIRAVVDAVRDPESWATPAGATPAP